jgi:hypothetical protein
MVSDVIIFQNKIENRGYMSELGLWFFWKTMLMNPINHHDNHQGLFLFLITMQHW